MTDDDKLNAFNDLQDKFGDLVRMINRETYFVDAKSQTYIQRAIDEVTDSFAKLAPGLDLAITSKTIVRF